MRILAPYQIFAPERSTPRTAYWWRSFPEGALAESRWIEARSEQVGRTGSLGYRPVGVLTSGEALTMPGVSAEGNAAMRRVWLELHEELAGLSTSSEHRIVEGVGQCIHVDRPEAVVGAIWGWWERCGKGAFRGQGLSFVTLRLPFTLKTGQFRGSRSRSPA